MLKSFRVRIPPAALAELHTRLRRIRWPRGVTDSGGMPLSELEAITRYWLSEYHWAAHEREMNRLPHFELVGGDNQRLHYIHTTATQSHSMPLLLLHGWPGSFVEMLSLVPHLAGLFDLIVPSLPGFGFSDPPEAAGMSNERIAGILAELMTRLGYERFAVHGGDVGAGIATWLARRLPERVECIHLNYIPGSYAPHVGPALSDEESAFLRLRSEWVQAHGGYAHMQSTRPLTLAYALSDSPLGLAAWICEKFREWADPRHPSRSIRS